MKECYAEVVIGYCLILSIVSISVSVVIII